MEEALEQLMDAVAAQHASGMSSSGTTGQEARPPVFGARSEDATDRLRCADVCRCVRVAMLIRTLARAPPLSQQKALSSLAQVSTTARPSQLSAASGLDPPILGTVVPDDTLKAMRDGRRSSLDHNLACGRPAHESSLFGISRLRSLSRTSSLPEDEAGTPMGGRRRLATRGVERNDDSAHAGVMSPRGQVSTVQSAQVDTPRKQPKVAVSANELGELDCLVVEVRR